MNSAEKSPAGKVLMEAIELNIEGRSPYPDRAVFVDADSPSTEFGMRLAARQGVSVVLVAANGETRILPPEAVSGS